MRKIKSWKDCAPPYHTYVLTAPSLKLEWHRWSFHRISKAWGVGLELSTIKIRRPAEERKATFGSVSG